MPNFFFIIIIIIFIKNTRLSFALLNVREGHIQEVQTYHGIDTFNGKTKLHKCNNRLTNEEESQQTNLLWTVSKTGH